MPRSTDGTPVQRRFFFACSGNFSTRRFTVRKIRHLLGHFFFILGVIGCSFFISTDWKILKRIPHHHNQAINGGSARRNIDTAASRSILFPASLGETFDSKKIAIPMGVWNSKFFIPWYFFLADSGVWEYIGKLVNQSINRSVFRWDRFTPAAAGGSASTSIKTPNRRTKWSMWYLWIKRALEFPSAGRWAITRCFWRIATASRWRAPVRAPWPALPATSMSAAIISASYRPLWMKRKIYSTWRRFWRRIHAWAVRLSWRKSWRESSWHCRQSRATFTSTATFPLLIDHFPSLLFVPPFFYFSKMWTMIWNF